MLTELEKDVLSIVEDHIGLSNAITRDEILRELYLKTGKDHNERNLRLVIRALRFSGYPVIGSSHGGYCFPESEDEGINCVDTELINRGIKIIESGKPLKMAIRNHFRGKNKEQLELRV